MSQVFNIGHAPPPNPGMGAPPVDGGFTGAGGGGGGSFGPSDPPLPGVPPPPGGGCGLFWLNGLISIPVSKYSKRTLPFF